MNDVNETPLDGGGFRRTSPVPPPGAVARLRALLLAAAHGQSETVRDGLARLGSWKNLPLLMNGPWFGESFGESYRDTVTSRRALLRRLRLLGTRPISMADAALLPRGQPVLLAGKARMPPGKSLSSYIWANHEPITGNVRLLLEEGHDFFLEDKPNRNLALVAALGGHLVEGDRVRDGDQVEVFGFVDQVVDPRLPRLPRFPALESPAAAASGRHPPLCLSVRSGDELTLIIRKVS